MMIQTYDHSYQVIRCLDSTEETTEYLCRELRRSKEELCLLVCIHEQVLAERFTLFLEEKIHKEEFTDYKECFQEEGSFYAVFACRQEPVLADRLLKERLSLTERVSIARGLFEWLLLQNPHPYFAVNALRPSQITVSRSLEVRWNYHLEQLWQFDQPKTEDVAFELAQILALLFARELDQMLYPELDLYLGRMESGQFSAYLDMYRAFLAVSEVLLEEPEKERTPRTFWFRLWERIKILAGFLKRILMVLLLIATVLYVVFVLLDDSGSEAGQQVMKQIGDLEIEQQTEQSKEEQ